MTDENLDKLMRKVLIDALRMEWSDALNESPTMSTTKEFQHQMKVMLRDPFAWYHKKTRPLWKKVLQTVATVVLVISLSFGTLMVTSPNARARVIQWVREWYETHIVYRYSGEVIPEEMPQYEISNLPEGYQEIDRFTFSSYVSVIYQNEEGLPLYLDYNFIQQGGAHDFVTTNMDVSDIIVNGHAGQLFIAQDSNQGSAITWVDENQNLQFTIDGFADRESLLNMAESVRQCLLRLGIDMTEQRLAVFFVADNDAALPASVLTLAHHPVTGRSSFCHVFHFLWIHFLFATQTTTTLLRK